MKLTDERKSLLRKTILGEFRGLEQDYVFLELERTDLSIEMGQIFAVPDFNPLTGLNVTVLLGYKGLRVLAERTGESIGRKILFSGPEGQWSQIPPRKLFAAKAIITRSSFGRSVEQVVYFKSFNVPSSRSWNKYPSKMIEKVAEAHALRKAFPHVFGSLYIVEEYGFEQVGSELITPKETNDALNRAKQIASVCEDEERDTLMARLRSVVRGFEPQAKQVLSRKGLLKAGQELESLSIEALKKVLSHRARLQDEIRRLVIRG